MHFRLVAFDAANRNFASHCMYQTSESILGIRVFFGGMFNSFRCYAPHFHLLFATFLHSSANYCCWFFAATAALIAAAAAVTDVVCFIFGGCFWSLTFNIQCIFHFRFNVPYRSIDCKRDGLTQISTHFTQTHTHTQSHTGKEEGARAQQFKNPKPKLKPIILYCASVFALFLPIHGETNEA